MRGPGRSREIKVPNPAKNATTRAIPVSPSTPHPSNGRTIASIGAPMAPAHAQRPILSPLGSGGGGGGTKCPSSSSGASTSGSAWGIRMSSHSDHSVWGVRCGVGATGGGAGSALVFSASGHGAVEAALRGTVDVGDDLVEGCVDRVRLVWLRGVVG